MLRMDGLIPARQGLDSPPNIAKKRARPSTTEHSQAASARDSVSDWVVFEEGERKCARGLNESNWPSSLQRPMRHRMSTGLRAVMVRLRQSATASKNSSKKP